MEFVNRHITEHIASRIPNQPVIVITGARQTGKTTLGEYQLPSYLNLPATYISFDDPDERFRFKRSAVTILRSVETPLVILDEVQKIPELFDPLKLVADEQIKKGGGKLFVLTGSSQLLLMKNIRETLAGRSALFDLHPFSLAETVGNIPLVLNRIWQNRQITAQDVETFDVLSPDQIRRLLELRDSHRLFGGYPPVWHRKEARDKSDWLRDYRRTYIERDISEVGQVANIDTFAWAQKLLCARTGNILSISDVARDLSLSVNTVKRYISLLTMTFQCVLLPPFHENISKRLIKSPKIFFPDAGSNQAILGDMSVSHWAAYETWVFSELLKWKAAMRNEPSLYFYRTCGGMEIDFVISEQGTLLPIEAKCGERVTATDGRHLETFVKEHPDKCRIALVVYPGKELTEIRHNVLGSAGLVFVRMLRIR